LSKPTILGDTAEKGIAEQISGVKKGEPNIEEGKS
jgi:hypothetical protein